MLRCVMLAKWFSLSDPQLEENLKDRLSFRRFAGLRSRQERPMRRPSWFPARLREAGLDKTLFTLANKHLEASGVAW